MKQLACLACLFVACDGSRSRLDPPLERLEVPADTSPVPPPPPTSRCPLEAPGKIGGHSAAAVDDSLENTALLKLLQARQYHHYVYGSYDPTVEAAAKLLVRNACALDLEPSQQWPGFDERRNVVEAATLDDLFPPEAVLAARRVGCGIVYLCDGKRERGKGVTWDH